MDINWNMWIDKFLSFINTIDYPSLSIFMLTVMLFGLFIKLHLAKNSRFDVNDLITANGKASLEKTAQFTAFLISSWAFIYLTLTSKLTEWFLTIYMSAWVANLAIMKYLDSRTQTSISTKRSLSIKDEVEQEGEEELDEYDTSKAKNIKNIENQ